VTVTAVIRVLLADDDLDIREALRDLLAADPGLDVVAVCPDGVHARDRVQHEAPDVAVLDVRMPGGGADLVRDLRARGVGVVCFSADASAQEEMLAAGAAEFLVKGGRLVDLGGAIRRVAHGAS
jgi:DNA-binding NarL/FixJ family response regulator